MYRKILKNYGKFMESKSKKFYTIFNHLCGHCDSSDTVETAVCEIQKG